MPSVGAGYDEYESSYNYSAATTECSKHRVYNKFLLNIVLIVAVV